MKIELDKENNKIFLTGGGTTYEIVPKINANINLLAGLFERDIVEFTVKALEEAVAEEDIKGYVEGRYPICKSGHTMWAEGFQSIMIRESKKVAEWVVNRMKNQMRKNMRLF